MVFPKESDIPRLSPRWLKDKYVNSSSSHLLISWLKHTSTPREAVFDLMLKRKANHQTYPAQQLWEWHMKI
jgi:hypothetical protein